MLLIDKINRYFASILTDLRMDNMCEFYKVNKQCENIFCGLFNIIYDINLINMDKVKKNFPAIDLGDYNSRICYQVTSRKDANKIVETFKTFIDHKLYKDFDFPKILILGEKSKYKNRNINYKGHTFNIKNGILNYKNYIFNINKQVVDFKDVLDEIPNNKLYECVKYFDNIYDINFDRFYGRDVSLFNLFQESFEEYIGKKIEHFYEKSLSYTILSEKLVYGLEPFINEWNIELDKRFLDDDLEYFKKEILINLNTIDCCLYSEYLTMDADRGSIFIDKSKININFDKWEQQITESQININKAYNNMHNLIYKGPCIEQNHSQQMKVFIDKEYRNTYSKNIQNAITPFTFAQVPIVPFTFTQRPIIPFRFIRNK